MDDALVEQLVQLGLTRNQSIAYLTLLADDSGQGLTGYEVGARSGVPRSAVYKVLQQLQEQGAAFAVGQDPQRFVAADPDQWVSEVRQRALSRMDALVEALRALPQPTRPEPVWIVRRYDEVVTTAAELIRTARSSIYLSAWAREIEALRPALDDVADRDLHRVLHCPEPLPSPPSGFSCWCATQDPRKSSWSHNLLLVVDRRQALMGGAEPGEDNDAVRTANPSLVDVATNHLILDVTLLANRAGRSCDEVVAPMMRPNLRGTETRDRSVR
ncbi:MAG: TrmB family transcriptional regulator [Myxococcales bacterium]|nr:TrmB family transcriptional regulator [Myxococcales bacterium]